MESLDLNSSVESDGLQFQGFVSQEVLQVSPALMLEPLQFQIGLRIKNNTSAPIRVNLFDTLSCIVISTDGSVTQCSASWRRSSPSESHFPIILPGETWLDAHQAKLSLLVDGGYDFVAMTHSQGYNFGWMTRWWRRFLKSVNPKLAYSSVHWDIEHPLNLLISQRGGGQIAWRSFKLGRYRIAMTHRNEHSSSEFYDRTTKSMKPVENLWVGEAADVCVTVNLARSP